MSIQPIETKYAGHRFRSRLEARWAVLFDKLNIAWAYEPQGYLVGPNSRPYLPDFYLPRQGLWVEVKGTEAQLDIELMLHASLLDGGLPRADEPYSVSGHEARLLILGPLGRGLGRVNDSKTDEHVGYTQPVHGALTVYKGDFFQGYAYFEPEGVVVDPGGGMVGNDSPEILWDGQGTAWGNFVGGGVLIRPSYEQKTADAYRAAISARFEHGEHG